MRRVYTGTCILLLTICGVYFGGILGQAAPVSAAAASCTVAPGNRISGATARVTCTGFGSKELVRIYWDTPSGLSKGSFTATSAGGGSTTFAVPDATGGAHSIIGKGNTSGSQATVAFTVKASLSVTPVNGKVATTPTIRARGFAAGETVTLRWVGTTNTILKTVVATSTGSVTTTVTIPETPRGAYSLKAIGPTTTLGATTPYTVDPSISLFPSTNRVGSSVKATLRGYLANEVVTLRWYDGTTFRTLGTPTATSSKGTLLVSADVPESVAGVHKIEGSGASGTLTSAGFTTVSSISLSSTFIYVGDNVTATLRGFAAGETIAVKWFADTTNFSTLGTVTASSLGSASFVYSVPDAVANTHKVQASGATSLAIPYANQVVKPGIRLTPSRGPSGTSVTAQLGGFKAAEAITVKWFSSSTTSTTVGTATASASGAGTVTFVAPTSARGTYKVQATSATSGSSVITYFTIGANVSLNTATGPAGTSVTATMVGFDAGESIELKWFSTSSTSQTLQTVTASGSGTASVTFTVPEATGGVHAVQALGSTSGADVTTNFTVASSMSISATSGKVGNSVTLTFRGYGASELVNVNWFATSSSSTVVATTTSSATGNASATFNVPDTTSGSHDVQGVGSTSGTSVTRSYTVAPSLALSPATGSTSSSTMVTMTGYGANESITVNWFSTTTTSVIAGTVTAGADGSATLVYTIPVAVSGAHKVQGVSATSGTSVFANFTIVPTATISPTSGPVGTAVTVNLRGYRANESVTVNWFTTSTTSSVVGTTTVSTVGSGTVTFAVPAGVGGIHKVTGVSASSGTGIFSNFTVTPSMSLTATSGKVGTSVTANVSGYAAGETVTINWFNTPSSSSSVGSATASASGTAAITFTVPAAAAGGHDVRASGPTSGTSSTTPYTVSAKLTLTPTSGVAGSTVTADLSGYGASESVTIRWYSTTTSSIVVKTVTVGATGSATTTFAVPASQTAGAHKVEGTGVTTGQIAFMDFTRT